MPRARRRSKGNLNRLFVDFVHQYFKDYAALIFVDGLLHAFVEKNRSLSIRKFRKFNAPLLLERLDELEKPLAGKRGLSARALSSCLSSCLSHTHVHVTQVSISQ